MADLSMYTGSKTRKAVVTGGAGFIGSHLVEELIKLGWQIIVIDDLSSGKLENLSPFLHEKMEFIQASVTDLPMLQNRLRGVDYVFHQAAISSVPRSIDNPMASHETNINGTLNVLIAARDNKVKKVMFASSASIYGDAPVLPKHEEMLPNPLSPYAVNKLTGEYYCRVFNKVYGLPTVCLRYFNVYGPRQNPNSQYAAVVPKFIRAVLEGKSPEIFGDGEQSRDFIFVKDVAAANIMAAESKATGIFNIGTGESITLNHLIFIVLKNLNRENIKPKYH